MKALFDNEIRKVALDNSEYKKVIRKNKNSQVIVMNLKPKEDTEIEVQLKFDKISIIVQGKGVFTFNGKRESFQENSLVYVPKGVEHKVTNSGDKELKVLTICAPQNYMRKSL